MEGGAKESEGEKGEGSLNNFLKFITGSGGRGYVWDVEFLENKKNAVLLSKYFLNTKLNMYIVATRNPAFHVFKKYFRKRKYMQLCKFTQKYAIFFLSGFSFTNIHSSQDGRGRRIFLTPFYLFPVSQTLGH